MFHHFRDFVKREEARSIGAAALIVSFFGIASRILGLVRDRILAAHYGAGDILDVYYAAFRLPDFIFELLIVGSFAAAFIPVFSALRARNHEMRAWKLAQDVLLTLFLIIAILSLFGMIFAPTIMHLIVPGFTRDKIDMATAFARIMFISPLFLVLSAVLGGVLISLRRFSLYASAPLFYNAGIIFGITVLVPLLHNPIGLAWGVVFGAFLHFCIHIIALRTAGWQLHMPDYSFYKTRDVKRVLSLMLPRIFGSASHQISLLFTTFFTSLLAAGSLTIFTFAYNIQSVILGLIGISFALAVFPTLSTAYAKKDYAHFNHMFERTLRRILYYAIPLSMFFWVLRAQLVRVIYGAGNFDWADTILTVQVLSILLFAVFAQVLIPLLARVFYAAEDTKTPVYVAFISQAVNVLLMISLIDRFAILAVAIAFSVSTGINAALLFIAAKRKFTHLSYKRIYHAFLYITLSSLIAAFVVHAVKTLIGTVFSLTYVWEVFIQLTLSGTAGVLMYLGVSALFGLQEFETIKKKIIVRMFGRPIVAGEEQHHGMGSS